MSIIIITEYSSVGSLNATGFTQAEKAAVPCQVVARQELDGSGGGEASAVFHKDTKFVKVHSLNEPVFFGFTNDPANLVAGARDSINEREHIFHGVYEGGRQIYDRISVVDESGVT